jgi:hypothetical protein
MYQCEVCQGTYSKLVKHHIQSKSHGGKNNKYNLTNICPNCHMLVHTGKIIIEQKILTTAGMKVIWRLPETETVTGSLPQIYVYQSEKNKYDC